VVEKLVGDRCVRRTCDRRSRALRQLHRGPALVGLSAGLAAFANPAVAAPLLAPVWTDNAVIQRDAPINVSGTAGLRERVTGTLGSQSATATADDRGVFRLSFPQQVAGGAPLTLRVAGSDGSVTEVRNLAVGDVWLCSGQSNMEYTVDRALNGGGIAFQANDPDLRLLQISKDTASIPASSFKTPVAWAAASRTSVPRFSAVCYHMGQELRAKLGIPIGLIHSSWGGSRLRPWLSPDAAEKLYGKASMEMLRQHSRDPLGAVTAFAPEWEKWYRDEAGGGEPWLNPNALAWSDVPKISAWNEWTGSPLATAPTGTVWLRKTVTLTPEQAKAGATLKIGIIDDLDMTFVNGRAVGNTFSWDAEREYHVPGSYLRAGVNEIMIAITNSWDKGGFSTGADKLQLAIAGGQTIPLPDGWRYSVAPTSSYPPRPPWDSNGGSGVMYNSMIAPLGRIALKGAAWYQGESDVDMPGYDERLRALFAGWRNQFSPNMRMLVVQLANFGPPQTAPVASGWAALREEQRAAVASDANAALATAIDIGERTDIHPANKLLLGKRLAMAAQGIALPMPVAAAREAGSVRVRFSGVEGGLAAWSGAAPLGFELCASDQSSCRYASAKIDGTSVVLADDGRPATRVRYAWADSPIVNLFDARAQPVPGFELPITGR
jgi:sialate O-acetylesterase